MFMLKMLRL